MAIELQAIASNLESSEQFAGVEVSGSTLNAGARDVEARYELTSDAAADVIALKTPNRWLSESIEADLMHTGDRLEELLEEELIELDLAGQYAFKHFRDEELQYVFSVEIPESYRNDKDCSTFIQAFEMAFRELGDMAGEDE